MTDPPSSGFCSSKSSKARAYKQSAAGEEGEGNRESDLCPAEAMEGGRGGTGTWRQSEDSWTRPGCSARHGCATGGGLG